MTEKTRGALAGWFGHSAPPTPFRAPAYAARTATARTSRRCLSPTQEGLLCTVAHTRFHAVVAGGSGPDFIIGKATTRGSHQSVLSKQLNLPVKWSYRKLILWWALVFLSIGWIVFYINAVTKNSAAVFFASVDPFRAVVCRHVPTAAGSVLEASLTMPALSSLFFAFFNFSVTFFLFLSAPHRPLRRVVLFVSFTSGSTTTARS